MKKLLTCNKNIAREVELPTLEEKVDALLEGGQKLAAMKQRIAAVHIKYPQQ